ncbi:GGDEF domain-containing protein [Paenibacillus caui]|uniref:GGDEF domain-containing protein n=1 Tax=Paenibacillus caui TaxID=2873927 RepID=UPI001CA8A05F|nr:GGDEF domain-containing protein [Paenibacillus caui]
MLKYRISHDAMTGLRSREFFEEQMERLNKQEPVSLSLAICDMNNLKRINDTLGHKMGDIYIKEAAELLKSFASDRVVISRIGGDEFTILITGMSEEEGAELIHRMKEAAANAQSVSGVTLGMSIGYAYTECSLGKVDELFAEADRKMYEIKRAKHRPNPSEGGEKERGNTLYRSLTGTRHC